MRRRTLAGSVFFLVLLSVAVGGHAYLAARHALAPGWAPPVRTALLALFAGLFAGLFLYPFGRRRVPRPLARAWAWTANVWMGVAFLGLVATLASDAVVALLGAAAPAGELAPLLQARTLAVAAVVGLASSVALGSALRPPRVVRVDVPLARWPAALDGLRIVQVSDIHIGPLLDRRFAAQLVTRVNALEPDLVVVTGDLVDGSVKRVGAEVAPFAGLRARHGVFFVTGNHDFYSGADPWVARVEALGWRVLRNERVRIEHAGAGFDLAGVDDHHGALLDPREGEDLPRALAGWDRRAPLVLLAHDPATFRRASREGVDLQLSGHTHGGQIWPFHGLVRLTVPWVAGLYRVNGSTIYVSRGTGFWGPPMRLGAPAEITELTVRSAAAQYSLVPEMASQGPTVSSRSASMETVS